MARERHGTLRVALTRESGANAELAAILQAAGAEVFDCPLIRILPPRDPAPLRAALAHLDEVDWLILTSANAARAVAERGLPARDGPQVACVGEATASVAREAGGKVDLVPSQATREALLHELVALGVNGRRLLWPRSELAPPGFREALQAAGATVDDPVAYRNEPDAEGSRQLRALLERRKVDAIAFASASAARNAATACGGLLSRARLYAIGPGTARALRQAGLKVAGEAADQSAEGLAQAILAGESRGE
jgi:uroporphyrinogen III methyltransferase / synthase